MELVLGVGFLAVALLAVGLWLHGKEGEKEIAWLRGRVEKLEEREREAINTILMMRQQGFTAPPMEDDDTLETWALDNEHEVEVERNRLGEKVPGERVLDLPPE